jgi:GH43 family beta-xylosidase
MGMGSSIMARVAGALVAASLIWSSDGAAEDVSPDQPTFVNPLYRGQDPWIIRHKGFYYLCQSDRSRGIIIYKSNRLTDRGQGKTVWRAPVDGWNRAQIWAPELHRLNDRWYIYYAASGGENETHRMGVLESLTDDPQGQYIDRGILYTGDDIERKRNNRWAIDGTILQHKGKIYLIWSGWPDHRDIQYLYIARMENPWTIASDRVRICANDDYEWERVSENRRERGLNEAPQALIRNGRIFLIYSCSGAWQATYKLGMLWMDENADPMDPASWRKHPRPVFRPTNEVPGPGHCCFATSPDGREDWIIYHAKLSPQEGWSRSVRMQKFGWSADGFPDFGRPAAGGRALALPAGEAPALQSSPELVPALSR